ncbi:polyketide cyclase [Caulobacter segnis]|uniref:Cyclase/dehydrase n=2 Tax=Caulobacter segnis TaxID=88688 RepID=D5VIR8_CAUST|nr:SRPBCC family protein [Caulobacter segnis]ADG09884.1 cyclase/dehydrase [Caulobacter segnis ATCC 21756]AVQ01643.1 polyketide cyclase [Caulobacter segnis]
MRRWILFVLASWVVSAASANAFELTPKANAALKRGEAYAEVTPDADGVSGHVRAVIDIDAPVQRVWRTMTDCAAAKAMISTLTGCRVVEGEQARGWDIREHITRRNLVFPSMRIVFRSDYEPYNLIRFRLVEGDLKVQQGEWRLQALDGGRRTRVFYENRLAVDWPVPKALMREALRRDTPKVLMNLRRVCE